jgi:hypothetical protein
MTLLICVFAAIIATVKWYQRKDDTLMPGVPCILFWGASLMWLGDAIFGYIEDGAAFFEPEAAEMLNDAYLGLSVVALGLILWLIILLIRDPKGAVKAALKKRAAK